MASEVSDAEPALSPDQQKMLILHIQDWMERWKNVTGLMLKLQDELDTMRLLTKYLEFDLEATKRENALLRRIIEDTTDRGSSGSDST